MQLKKNGIVPFSLRQRDLDLRGIVEKLPDRDGSEILREILRDGIAYQKLVRQGEVIPTRLTSMIQYMDLGFIVGDEDEIIPVKKQTVNAPPPPEPVEEVEEIVVENFDAGEFNIGEDEFL